MAKDVYVQLYINSSARPDDAHTILSLFMTDVPRHELVQARWVTGEFADDMDSDGNNDLLDPALIQPSARPSPPSSTLSSSLSSSSAPTIPLSLRRSGRQRNPLFHINNYNLTPGMNWYIAV
jgi:hypothetical protein